ncbi:hypothetical protein H4217_001886 [Coemansia sp. RSA 1939]|nr:hypothetical protein H4217_001886 [Coemansia sp. RSA 1939]
MNGTLPATTNNDYNVLLPLPFKSPLDKVVLLLEAHGDGIEWYAIIDGRHVLIRADTEDEIMDVIHRLLRTGELEAYCWDYTDIYNGVVRQGKPWTELYEPEVYGPGIRQYSWNDFEIGKTERYIVHCKEAVIKRPGVQDEQLFKMNVKAYLEAGEHENIIKLQGLLVHNGKVEGMVLERYKAPRYLSVRDLLDLCAAVQHIHSKGMVHGNIHPGTIVRPAPYTSRDTAGFTSIPQPASAEEQDHASIDDPNVGRLCVIDFACNSRHEQWSTPDVLNGEKPTVKSDVYSIGLLCEISGYRMAEAVNKNESERCDLASLIAHLNRLLPQDETCRLE